LPLGCMPLNTRSLLCMSVILTDLEEVGLVLSIRRPNLHLPEI
jgi:hypothetical protein